MSEIPVDIKINNSDAKKKVEDIKESFKSMTKSANSDANTLRKTFKRAFKDITNNIKKRFKKAFADSFRIIKSFFKSLTGTIAGFIGVFSFQELTNQTFEVASAFIATENALLAVTGSGQRAGKVMEYLKDLGRNLGTDVNVLAESFLKFSAAGAKSKLTSDELLNVFEALAETSVILQFSQQQLEGAFRAITQMMSKGKVQAEELRGQLGEHLPGAFEIAASSMSLTTKELDTMLKQGQITAEMLLRKLPEGLREAYGSALPAALKTSRAEFGRLKNDVLFFIEENKEAIDKLFATIAFGLRQILQTAKQSSLWELLFKDTSGKLEKFIREIPLKLESSILNIVSFFKSISAQITITKLKFEDFMFTIQNSKLARFAGFGGDIEISQKQQKDNLEELLNAQIDLKDIEEQRLKGLTEIENRFKSISLESRKLKDIERPTFLTRSGEKEPDRLTARFKEFEARLGKIDKKFKEGKLSVSEYQLQIVSLNRKFSELKEIGLGSLQGLKSGFEEFAREAGDAFNNFADFGKRSMQSFEDTFVKFAQTGKFAFKDFANSILSDLLRIMIRMQIVAPLARSLGIGFDAGTTIVPGSIASPSPISPTMGGGGFGAIAGNGLALNNGSIMPFANGGIVNRPTIFPMKKGSGLMGEAGPEAIMPLSRGSDGKLGVRSQPSNVIVNITNTTGAQASQSESVGPSGEKVIDILIEEKIGNLVRNGQFDKFMKPYGGKRRGTL